MSRRRPDERRRTAMVTHDVHDCAYYPTPGRDHDAEQMALPGYRLHPLSGDLKGFWSVTVNGNWRVIFRFEDGQPRNVDLIDYH